MSNAANHKRGHGKIQDHGPTWENRTPAAGCNSTHVARSRRKWKRRAARAERRSGRNYKKFHGRRYKIVEEDMKVIEAGASSSAWKQRVRCPHCSCLMEVYASDLYWYKTEATPPKFEDGVSEARVTCACCRGGVRVRDFEELPDLIRKKLESQETVDE